MSEQQQEQQQGEQQQGEQPAPPQVDPITPPQPEGEPPEPVGRTPEAEHGLPPSDESQGVGVAPTQDGDSEDGTSGTKFQTTEEIEAAQQGGAQGEGGGS